MSIRYAALWRACAPYLCVALVKNVVECKSNAVEHSEWQTKSHANETRNKPPVSDDDHVAVGAHAVLTLLHTLISCKHNRIGARNAVQMIIATVQHNITALSAPVWGRMRTATRTLSEQSAAAAWGISRERERGKKTGRRKGGWMKTKNRDSQ